MEHVNCMLCGADDFDVVWDKDDRKAKNIKSYSGNLHANDGNILNGRNVQCNKCGLVYVNPRMTETELEEFYRNEYRNYYGKDLKATEGSSIIHGDHALDVLRDSGAARNQDDRLLDIGCASGVFLEQCKNVNFKYVQGIEPNRATYQIARNKGLAVANVDIEHYEPTDKFDIITIQNTLEHICDPKKMLKKVGDILNDDGYLLISVPDLMTQVYWTSMDAWFSCAHLYSFTHITLTNLLAQCGFMEHQAYNYFENVGDKLIVVYRKCTPATLEYIKPVKGLMAQYTQFWHNVSLANNEISQQMNLYINKKYMLLPKRVI